jgi:hypothetical protein
MKVIWIISATVTLTWSFHTNSNRITCLHYVAFLDNAILPCLFNVERILNTCEHNVYYRKVNIWSRFFHSSHIFFFHGYSLTVIFQLFMKP